MFSEARPIPARRGAVAGAPLRAGAGGPERAVDAAGYRGEGVGEHKEGGGGVRGENTEGECAAAWDEVEELSAAASHARDKLKENDPLENYCKDNPETDECRTYED
uniref:CP12 domain-containing protein n=1 Tax=Ananas comosus var. bracteatus TaxID=296719 RepID=A0A6V7PDD7_ANACO|nr:unnamed protein product [Ananas comosus var. bracteatus]